MNEAQRNFLTAGVLCAASASLIGGMVLRERIEDRGGLVVSTSFAPLLASRDPKVEIPEERYFYDLLVLLKREYVDPIPSEMPLAVGSVKGMISSLDDEQSIYMSKPMFQSFVKTFEGKYEGIGANLALRRAQKSSKPIRTTLDLLERIPTLRVTFVAPNSPAAKAGLKAGDEIDRIDTRWVVNPEIVGRFRKIDAQVAKKELPESAKTAIQTEIRNNFKESMMPMRALERLTTGTSGELKLGWRRAGKLFQAQITKGETALAVNTVDANGVLRPSFTEGSIEAFKRALDSNKVTAIDLRGMEQGDLKEVRGWLAAIGPAGEYGRIVKDTGHSEPLSITKGAPSPKPIKLLVDANTSGVAEAFVLALKSKGLATIEGGPTAGKPWIVERTTLPDGSGFTLRVGMFKVKEVKA